MRPKVSAFCNVCGAWRGVLGLEPTLDLYVGDLVEVFREVKRVLRKDGTLWLNLGDSYAGSNKGVMADGSIVGGPKQSTNKGSVIGAMGKTGIPAGLKPKDLCMVPFRVALALQADGWWVRSTLPWIKWAGMPDSTSDRPGSAVEYWFLLSKSERYYWDSDAVRRPQTGNAHSRGEGVTKKQTAPGIGIKANSSFHQATSQYVDVPGGRSMRNSDLMLDNLDAMIAEQHAYLLYLHKVRNEGGLLLDEAGEPLAIVRNPKGFPGAHFATFCEELIAPLIAAGTSEAGVCGKCGAPWRRVMTDRPVHGPTDVDYKDAGARRGKRSFKSGTDYAAWAEEHPRVTVGWQPSCTCGAEVDCETCDGKGDVIEGGIEVACPDCLGAGVNIEAPPPVPGVVLDPFAGSGTVGLVAVRLGRRAILIDAKPEYCAMAQERVAQLSLVPAVEEPVFVAEPEQRRLLPG